MFARRIAAVTRGTRRLRRRAEVAFRAIRPKRRPAADQHFGAKEKESGDVDLRSRIALSASPVTDTTKLRAPPNRSDDDAAAPLPVAWTPVIAVPVSGRPIVMPACPIAISLVAIFVVGIVRLVVDRVNRRRHQLQALLRPDGHCRSSGYRHGAKYYRDQCYGSYMHVALPSGLNSANIR
jgi:hypothetical protein